MVDNYFAPENLCSINALSQNKTLITPRFRWHVISRYLSYTFLSIPARCPMERESPLNGACETSSSTTGNLKENPLQSSLKITKHTKPSKENFTSKHNHPVHDNRSDEEE